MTPTRCPQCDAPATIRAGRVTLAHLTWCPRAPRPPAPARPSTTASNTATADQIAAEAARIHADLEARAAHHRDDEAQARRTAGIRAAATARRTRLHELGVTSTQVLAWARRTGHTTRTDPQRGPASRALIEAYARAHDPAGPS